MSLPHIEVFLAKIPIFSIFQQIPIEKSANMISRAALLIKLDNTAILYCEDKPIIRIAIFSGDHDHLILTVMRYISQGYQIITAIILTKIGLIQRKPIFSGWFSRWFCCRLLRCCYNRGGLCCLCGCCFHFCYGSFFCDFKAAAIVLWMATGSHHQKQEHNRYHSFHYEPSPFIHTVSGTIIILILESIFIVYIISKIKFIVSVKTP